MVRSDASIAALKDNRQDSAREYLAMTGEGRLPDGPFAFPADTEVPACGGDLKPTDVVVVEFGIGEDGKVTFADPIYASRQGPIAVEFAKAVSGWAWRASDVKSIPLFYRAITRVEMRCSNALERPGEINLLQPALESWLASKGIQAPNKDVLRNASTLRAELDLRKNARPIEQLPYLFFLANYPSLDFQDRETVLQQAVKIVVNEQAPVAVQALFRIKLLLTDAGSWTKGPSQIRTGLRALLNEPSLADDPLSGSVIRLMLAAPARGAPPSDAASLLAHVVEDRRLGEHDPLRVGAMVRLASVQARQGDLASARKTYLGTGLNAQQCALVDAHPSLRTTGVGETDYPRDAIRLGIGGWTQIEFDIQSDGRTVNRRAILSYPPFVFGESTVKAMESARYTQTYRPDGAIGCSGASARFRYVAPN